MRNDDVKEFAKIIAGVAEDKSASISHQWVELCFERMRHHGITIDQFRQAAAYLIDHHVYKGMPSVADFLLAVKGTDEDNGEVQAALVAEAVQKKGGWESVDFADPVTAAVIQTRFGGWPKLCASLQADEINWFVKDFKSAYQSYARSDAKGLTHLPGRHELGYKGRNNKPELIGKTLKRLPGLEDGKKEKTQETAGAGEKILREAGAAGKGLPHRA